MAANLARAGFSTLLIEAGDDQSSNIHTQIGNLFSANAWDESIHWDFFVKHYSDMAETLKHNHLTFQFPNKSYWIGHVSEAPEGAELLGVNYPRGATLGGSAITNAMATLLPSDSDWDYVAEITGDNSWK